MFLIPPAFYRIPPRIRVKIGDYESKPDSVTTWALRASVALAFVLTGIDKFPAGPASYWVRTFDAIGFGQWFRYFTGIVEALGGLLFLWPAATTLGAAMLIVTMLGAMATQAFVFHHPLDSLFPAIYLAGIIAAVLKLRSGRRPGGRESRRSSS
jgi:putative oxidoreductase